MNGSARITGKLAAAAVAVAGVLGFAGTAAADDLNGPQNQEMGVSFDIEISDTARIEIAKQNFLTRDELWAGGLTAANKFGKDPGTLGVLKVNTTADEWDVKLTSLYGGKLVHAGEKTRDPSGGYSCPGGWTPNPWNDRRCQKGGEADIDAIPDSLPGEMKSLVYTSIGSTGDGIITGGTVYDTVQLVVKIGICDIGADLDPDAVQTDFYSLGDPPAFAGYPPVAITSAALKGTRKWEAVSGLAASQVEVSFAKTIGDAYDGSATDIPARNLNWNDISTNEVFARPKTPNGKSTQYFYVNVGMNTSADILENKSTNGNYKEMFTFTLSHNL